MFLSSRVRAASPNGKIGLGFIGCGIQSRGLLSGFLGKAETQVVAVCDVDTNRREGHRKTVEEFYGRQSGSGFKGCAVYNDFRELLARGGIDAVVVATPDHWHALIVIAAAAAGKDVYCEKPLTNTIHEARAVVDAISRKQRVLQTGSQQRSSREFRVACELVRNGVIGRISRVEAGFGGPPRPCDLAGEAAEPGLDWDLWLGPAPLRDYNEILSPRGVHKHFPMWRKYREYGGGMVTDWGAHHLDIAQWGLGMDESGPVEVRPPADWAKAEQGVRMTYANGVELTHIAENGVTFFGADGEVYVNRGKFRLTLRGEQKARFLAKEDQPALAAQLDAVEAEFLGSAKVRLRASTDHKADFLASIASRVQPIAGPEVGARTVTCCHLVNLAYFHGQTFRWDPAANQFAGGTGNPAWLTREYRGPWRVA